MVWLSHSSGLASPPVFFPSADSDKGFVILLGQEQYTTVPLVARGLALDPLNRNLYVWGNVILQRWDSLPPNLPAGLGPEG